MTGGRAAVVSRGRRGCARAPGARGRWRRSPPRGPSSGRVLSSCRARTASRGSTARGTPAAAGTRRKRIAASGGTLKAFEVYVRLDCIFLFAKWSKYVMY